MKNIAICYFRSLYSQSVCSLSMGKFSDYLLNKGYNTKLFLLKNGDHNLLINNYDEIIKNDTIIYKTNYKDFEYGIRIFQNILKHSQKKFYLVGPFASMNKDRILKKYSFVDDIIDIQDSKNIDMHFKKIGKKIDKSTIINGIDREIEYQEKGKYINLEASTGCIYNCAFCHIKLMKYNKFEKDMNLVVDEINKLYLNLGKRYFIFNDSVFWKNNNDNNRIEQFIELLKEKNIKIHFMIYLSLTIKISDELLKKLKEVGLIRIFFGVENISENFSIQNNKYVSSKDTKEFISKLEKMNISYHIGFMLFSKYTKFEELKENLDFLYEIKKLFRPGMLIEKTRILPNSKDSKYLYVDKSKIDQAYNYKIDDSKVEKYYQIVNHLFKNINIRNFEQFFSGINIALTLLKDEKINNTFHKLEKSYKNVLNIINKGIYEILIDELNTLNLENWHIEKLKDLYSIAEINYVESMKLLKKTCIDLYKEIPHGTEDLNVW